MRTVDWTPRHRQRQHQLQRQLYTQLPPTHKRNLLQHANHPLPATALGIHLVGITWCTPISTLSWLNSAPAPAKHLAELTPPSPPNLTHATPPHTAKKSTNKKKTPTATSDASGGNIADLDADDFLSGGFMSMAGLSDDEEGDGDEAGDSGGGSDSEGDSDVDDSEDEDAGDGEGEILLKRSCFCLPLARRLQSEIRVRGLASGVKLGYSVSLLSLLPPPLFELRLPLRLCFEHNAPFFFYQNRHAWSRASASSVAHCPPFAPPQNNLHTYVLTPPPLHSFFPFCRRRGGGG